MYAGLAAVPASLMLWRWAVERVLRFALTRVLGQFLETEVSWEQLEVQLGSLCIHLKNLRLNVAHLNFLVRWPGCSFFVAQQPVSCHCQELNHEIVSEEDKLLGSA